MSTSNAKTVKDVKHWSWHGNERENRLYHDGKYHDNRRKVMHIHFQGGDRDRKFGRQSFSFIASMIPQLSSNILKGQNTLNGRWRFKTGVDNGVILPQRRQIKDSGMCNAQDISLSFAIHSFSVTFQIYIKYSINERFIQLYC